MYPLVSLLQQDSLNPNSSRFGEVSLGIFVFRRMTFSKIYLRIEKSLAGIFLNFLGNF